MGMRSPSIVLLIHRRGRCFAFCLCTSKITIIASASVKDECVSPNGIAGSPDRSSLNSGNKCQLARPLMLPNFVALSKICAPAKVDQSSPQWNVTCYAQMPLVVPNFITLSQNMYEKSVTIFSLISILARSRPLRQSLPILALSMAPSTDLPNSSIFLIA